MMYDPLTKEILKHLLDFNLHKGDKLMAVKNFKIATQLGLKESKDAIEESVDYAMSLVTDEMLSKVYLREDNQVDYLPKPANEEE